VQTSQSAGQLSQSFPFTSETYPDPQSLTQTPDLSKFVPEQLMQVEVSEQISQSIGHPEQVFPSVLTI
jgi:hypothetical protein